MSKGIAIQTILLLVVGIIVAGALVYLIYYYTSSEQLSAHECRARLSELCTQCRNLNFVGFPLSSALTTECSQYSEFSGWNGIISCDNTTTDDLCEWLGIT